MKPTSTLTSTSTASPPSSELPWLTLVHIRECFVYQVRPSSTYFCEQWGLDKPMFQGALSVLAKDAKLILRLINPQNQSVFADSAELDCSSWTKPVSEWLIPVKDSSRYFVYRVKDPSSCRSVWIGIGFRERSDSFDLNAAIQDRLHQIHRIGLDDSDKLRVSKEEEEKLVREAEERLKQVKLASDLQLKDKITIHLNTTPIRVKRDIDDVDDEKSQQQSNGEITPPDRLASVPSIAIQATAHGLALTPPPPPAEQHNIKPKRAKNKSIPQSPNSTNNTPTKTQTHQATNSADTTQDNEDEFTDFASAGQ